jgi:hypothetical protein
LARLSHCTTLFCGHAALTSLFVVPSRQTVMGVRIMRSQVAGRALPTTAPMYMGKVSKKSCEGWVVDVGKGMGGGHYTLLKPHITLMFNPSVHSSAFVFLPHDRPLDSCHLPCISRGSPVNSGEWIAFVACPVPPLFLSPLRTLRSPFPSLLHLGIGVPGIVLAGLAHCELHVYPLFVVCVGGGRLLVCLVNAMHPSEETQCSSV